MILQNLQRKKEKRLNTDNYEEVIYIDGNDAGIFDHQLGRGKGRTCRGF